MPESTTIQNTDKPATIDSLTTDFRALGVTEGSVLLVHSSLSALGWVAGGSVAVVEALLRAVGASGTIVMPTLDESVLRQTAADNHGRYSAIQVDDRDLERFERSTQSLDAQTIAMERTADTWDDKGYLVALALLPLMLALFRRGWLLTLVPILFLLPSENSYAQSWDSLWLTPDQQGQRALNAGDSESAAQLFDNAQWAGTAAYQAEDFEAASEHFSQATEDADSWYNKGNALTRAGKLDEAIYAYEESLRLKPEQADAAENLKLVEELKKQQEQEQQENQENSEEQDGEQEQNQEEESSSENDENSQESEESESNNPSDSDNQDPAQSDPSKNEPSQEDPQEQAEDEAQQSPADDESQAEEQESEAQQAREEAAEAAEENEEANAAKATAQEQEIDQAMEQWLRRVPDDPSGLLREKFRYESQQRQQNRSRRDQDEPYW